METINLNKKVYAKNQYEKVIDTKFSQLATTITPSEQAAQAASTISVDQFFQEYQQLFLQIPKEGATNSHEYLVKTSSEYIGFTPTDDSIQALIEEINLLQQTNLELNQQLVNLATSGSQI
jgi:hypothetical protein